jgi:ribosomal RNA-processing protein 9
LYRSDFLQSIRNNHIGLIDESYEETETAPEKRLRLAKEYIRQLEEENDGEDDNGDDDTIGDYVAKKLHDEVLEKAKRLHKKVADQVLH